MEKLADHGNGNYAYIDNILEAKKVLVNEFSSTLFTIAKDVKIQIEFNPEQVAAYRLIGYENRMLEAEDFNNDKKDAGELGAGHTVTALYELVPPEKLDTIGSIDDLKYKKEKKQNKSEKSDFFDEMMTVKFRYKEPEEKKSKKIVKTVKAEDVLSIKKQSKNFRFSAAVAAFGQILSESEHINDFSFSDVLKLAKGGLGKDQHGYRHEFLQLVEKAELLNR